MRSFEKLFLGLVCGLAYLSQNVVEGVTIEKFLTLTYPEKVTLDKLRERIAPKLQHNYMKQDAYLILWVRGKNRLELGV